MSSDGKIRVPRITSHGGYTLDHTTSSTGNQLCPITSNSIPSESPYFIDLPSQLKLSTKDLQQTSLNYSSNADTEESEKRDGKCVRKCNIFKVQCSSCAGRFQEFIKPVTSHPLCPTYQSFARVVGIVLIGLILWGIGKSLVSSRRWTMLCGLVAAAEVVGMLVHSITALPPLLGMLLVGGAARNLGLMTDIHEHHLSFYVLRSSALVVLMIRIGFRLDPQRIRNMSGLLLGLATLPGIAECVVLAVMSHFLLGLPVSWALLLGLVLAAACPSVLRPSFYLMGGGKGLDAMLLSAAGINDVVAITILGLDMAVIFSNADNLPYQLLHRMMGVVGGLAVGTVYGIIARYIPEQNDPQVTELRTAMLVSLGLTALVGAERIGLTGGGPIACMIAAMVSNWGWQKQGWSTKYNPVATTFDVFWRIMQPIMFLLIGAEVELHRLSENKQFLAIAVGVLCSAWALRMGVSLLVTSRGNLNFKERLYISLAWLPKADVQAALSPLALDLARRRDVTSDALVVPATQCLIVVLLAVVITAPLSAGLVAKRGLAPLLLGKRKSQSELEAESNVVTTNVENRSSY